jgi:hypothetical protein
VWKVILFALVFATGCSSSAAVKNPSPTTTAPSDLPKVVTSDRIAFGVPITWKVVSSTCRCPWDHPEAVINGGREAGGIACSCPMEQANSPSTLNLYAGSAGLAPGGQVADINGLRAKISVNRRNASVSATFPDLDDWISIRAFPAARSATEVARQVALELQIVDSVRAASSGG